MLFDDLGESARILLQGRARAMGQDLTALARQYKAKTSQELAAVLPTVTKSEKPGLGLLLARVALEEALAARSRELFSRFLFRFGAHLKTSVSTAGLSSSQRLALASAAEKLFDNLPTASSSQRAEISSMRHRLVGPALNGDDWHAVLGIASGQFDSIIESFGLELRTGDRRIVNRPMVMPTPRSGSDSSRGGKDVPSWLTIHTLGEPDDFIAAGANWVRGAFDPDGPDSLQGAWGAFRAGRFVEARMSVEGSLGGLGSDWGPSSAADSLRSWNWLRLLAELARLEEGAATDTRRSWVSVCEYALRCVPDDPRIDDWLVRALGDFVANDLASMRAWSAYALRLVAAVGHEIALANYPNGDKAALRAAWQAQFGLDALEIKNTAAAAARLVPLYQKATQTLYVGARRDDAPSRVLRDADASTAGWLDEAEASAMRDAQDVFIEVERMIGIDSTTHSDLSEARAALAALSERIVSMGSAPLLDFLSPLVSLAAGRVSAAVEHLGDVSRPNVVVRLASTKLPFSGTSGSQFDIRFLITNTGNTAAEKVRLRVTAEDMELEGYGALDALNPGAANEVYVRVTTSEHAGRTVTLNCELEWSDALLQQFHSVTSLAAEDQKPATWSQHDVNPFNLGTISDPSRLVGRAHDLKSLDALLAGNASAYITGHKRVGKTSLTRVLLKQAAEHRGWAGSLLDLGRAIGSAQTAGELIFSLLDEIYYAVDRAYGVKLVDPTTVAPGESDNFARLANRWLRATAASLPPGARVLIAIDDFDELPQHLVEGPQADALFLFLRSLVDEPWLNLIVVGSEVLPSIIQAQAHKLNQVVPVSVTNFALRSSTAELLESPTADRLEWNSDAIDRVHYLTAGNPYYETLLAQRLWLTMRELSRSVVTAADVDDAAILVASEAPDSHFIHLWADSTSGLDHTARRAIVASAVLRSIARCGGHLLAPAAPDEVNGLAQRWIQTASLDELNQATATLRSREIVSTTGDRLLISIPLVGIWLQRAGAKALDGMYSNSQHATATVRMITDSDLVELSKNLRYRGEAVSEIRIRAWLAQFGGHDRQYLAYKMLRRMVLDGYFSSTRLLSVELPRLATAVGKLAAAHSLSREANNQYLKNAFLVNHGVAGDSTQGAISAFAKALRIKKANIVKVGDLPERIRAQSSGSVLFLLDDYCGSGAHLSRELLSIVESVSAMGEDWVERVQVVVGASVVAEALDFSDSAGAMTVEVVGGTFLGDRLRSFASGSGIFDSDEERSRAEEMTKSIGSALLPNNPLGYGGQALLTLFEFNCPNNVAPIFWKSGSVAGERWTPLFERMT